MCLVDAELVFESHSEFFFSTIHCSLKHSIDINSINMRQYSPYAFSILFQHDFQSISNSSHQRKIDGLHLFPMSDPL